MALARPTEQQSRIDMLAATTMAKDRCRGCRDLAISQVGSQWVGSMKEQEVQMMHRSLHRGKELVERSIEPSSMMLLEIL